MEDINNLYKVVKTHNYEFNDYWDKRYFHLYGLRIVGSKDKSSKDYELMQKTDRSLLDGSEWKVVTMEEYKREDKEHEHEYE